MNEDILNTLRQQDANLRNAIRLSEAEQPPMPADLNARLMERMKKEQQPKHTRRLWPWMAAACVATLSVLLLTQQKDTTPQEVTAHAEPQTVEQPKEAVRTETAVHTETVAQADPQPETTATPKRQKQPRKSAAAKQLLAQETTAAKAVTTEEPTMAATEVAQGAMPSASNGPQTLTDSDIPITRPENYKYTREELALMKRQATEAYLKWVELELEISKYNLEQTAQK